MKPLEPALGRRVTIRLRDGLGFRDIVGILTSNRTLINRDGEEISFDPNAIAIWREVSVTPDRAGKGAPLSLRIQELENLSEITWPPIKTGDYGKWKIRIDNGLSLRANSVLPLGRAPYGEPLKDIESSVAEIVTRYQIEKIKPAFSIAMPLYSELDLYLENNGWDLAAAAQFLVKDINQGPIYAPEGFDVSVSDSATKQWLDVQGDQGLMRIMNSYPAKYLTFTSSGKAVAVTRIAMSERWSIAARLFVLPEFRGKGLARALMQSAEKVAANSGATKIALQVESKNLAALELYEKMGYRHHHNYNYRILR